MTLSTQISPGVFLIVGLTTTLTPEELSFELSQPDDNRALGLARRLLTYSFETIDDEDLELELSEDSKGRWVGVSRTHFLRELTEAVGPLAEEEAAKVDVNVSLDPVGDAAMADLLSMRAQGFITFFIHSDDIVLCPTAKLINSVYKQGRVATVADIIGAVGRGPFRGARRPGGI